MVEYSNAAAQGFIGDGKNGWQLFAEVNKNGGYILRNITHQGRNFIRDIRVVRLVICSTFPYDDYPNINPNAESKIRSIILDSEDLPLIEGPARSSDLSSNSKLIEPYAPIMSIYAAYALTDPFGRATGKLEIIQKYLFTDYNNQPSHEPSGALQAARFYPLLQFTYTPAPEAEFPLIHIRADYRIEFQLDQNLSNNNVQGHSVLQNQAGIFADQEYMDFIMPPLSLDDIFSKIEKPVKYEVIGQGIKYGSPSHNWDNIHVWGLGRSLPSTPGAFHAAHTHWRWPYHVFSPTMGPADRIAGLRAKGRHFGGPSEFSQKEAGNPIIDPDNLIQNIRFAITKADLIQADEDWLNMPLTFDKVFTQRRSRPDVISKETPSTQYITYFGEKNNQYDGCRLVVWFSIDIKRDLIRTPRSKVWSGTMFLHGLFFAHEPDPNIPKAHALADPKAFLRDAHHRPHPDRHWVRPSTKTPSH